MDLYLLLWFSCKDRIILTINLIFSKVERAKNKNHILEIETFGLFGGRMAVLNI